MAKGYKLTVEEARKVFLNRECILLSDGPVNAIMHLEYQCKNGHISKRSLHNFQITKYTCEQCRKDIITQRKKEYFEKLKLFFIQNGCEILSTKYINSETKLDYRCSCKTVAQILPNTFKKGHRCRNCFNINQSKNRRGENSSRWKKDQESVKKHRFFRKKCQDMIVACVKSFLITKTEKTFNLLGYTNKDFTYRMENHPNWINVKNKRWSVDHIFPIIAFSNYKIYDFKIVNALENLQPLDFIENISKGGKYNVLEFEQYLRSKNIEFVSKIPEDYCI